MEAPDQRRLLSTDEGGRQTPVSGDAAYRPNWSIESDDPDLQASGPTPIDADALQLSDRCDQHNVASRHHGSTSAFVPQ